MGAIKARIEELELEDYIVREAHKQKEELEKKLQKQRGVDAIVDKMIYTFERDFFDIDSTFEDVVDKVRIRNAILLKAKEAPIPDLCDKSTTEAWEDMFDNIILKHQKFLEWKANIDKKFDIELTFGLDIRHDDSYDEVFCMYYAGIRVYLKAL